MTSERGMVPAGNTHVQTLAEVQSLAQTFYKSGLFRDVKDEAQAVVKIMYGQELGIGPMQSMLGVHVVDGKPSLAAVTMAMLIKRSRRYTFRPLAHDEQQCVLEFFEREDNEWVSLGQSSFTMQDAAAAGLSAKDVWKRYKRNMLWSRALSNGARWYCADVFDGPVYTPEELGADVDGETGAALPPRATVTVMTHDTPSAFDARLAAAAPKPPSRSAPPPLDPVIPPAGLTMKALHARAAEQDMDHDALRAFAMGILDVQDREGWSMKHMKQADARRVFDALAELVDVEPAPEPQFPEFAEE